MPKKESDFIIEFVNGPIIFKAEEGVLYTRLFNIVDYDGDELIGGTEGAAFIRRARLSNEINREIWRLASGGKSQTKLNKDSWFVAMKLVALAQNSGKLSMQPLLTGADIPLADFNFSGPPDNELPQNDHNISDDDFVFQVSISSPVMIGSGYSRYTQYAVSTVTNACSFPVSTALVYRRYSDFEWLFNRLSDRFRGTIIPPIPEKRWSGNMDATFIEERRQALEQFINEVARHSKLSTTLELQALLTTNSEGWAAAKDLMPNSSSYLPDASNVSSLWQSMKDGLSMSTVQQVEIKTDEELNKISLHIEDYEKHMNAVVQKSDVVYQAQRGEGYELSRFGSYLNAVSLHDKDDLDLHDFLRTTGDMFEVVSNLYQDQLDNILASFITPLRYQAGKVGAVKTVMHNRDAAIDEVQRANASMQRNKERFAAARASSGAAASALVAEKKMASAEDRMTTAKEQVEFIASSLKLEAKRLNEDRSREFRRLLLSFSNLQYEYREKSRKKWETLIVQLNISPEEMEASYQRVRKHVKFRKPGEEPVTL